jgi:hypothetical protein
MISVKLMRLDEEDLRKEKHRCVVCQKALRVGDLVIVEEVVRDSYRPRENSSVERRFSHSSCYPKENLRG